MSDPKKLRAIGLFALAGLIGVPLVYIKAQGGTDEQSPAATHAPRVDSAAQDGSRLGGDAQAPAKDGQAPGKLEADQAEAPPAPAIPDAAAPVAVEPPVAAKTPASAIVMAPVLRRYDAVDAMIGNTLEWSAATGPVDIYFGPRGVVLQFAPDGAVARRWERDDDRICQVIDADRRECFYVSLRLDDALLAGPMATLAARIAALPDGARIGMIDGFSAESTSLLHGNVKNAPGYVPLIEGKPADAWLKPRTREDAAFVGATLLRRRGDEDRAVTYFAPDGTVLEVTRLLGARQTVSLWTGEWWREGEQVCRDIPPAQESDGGKQSDGGKPAYAQECSQAQTGSDQVEFPAAAPERRNFVRLPWPDEETDSPDRRAERKEVEPRKAEAILVGGPGTRAFDRLLRSIVDLR